MRVKPVCVSAHTGFEYGEKMGISSELTGLQPLMYEMGVSCIKSTWVALNTSRLSSVLQVFQIGGIPFRALQGKDAVGPISQMKDK